jgi:FixJ family two-component response regulator
VVNKVLAGLWCAPDPDQRFTKVLGAGGAVELEQLVTGADSPTIAQRLVISEHTVSDHVKAILAETAVSTRARLLARISG